MSDLTDAHSPSAALLAKMESARRRLAGKSNRQQERASIHLDKAKALKARLRALEADMEIVSGVRELSVSLLHKEVSGAAYIKGRTWWNGKQREAQIGSIPAVLERLGVSTTTGSPDAPTWEQIKKDDNLIESIKALGREKLRQYIERRLEREHMGEISTQLPSPRQEMAEGEFLTRGRGATDTSADWYASWRSENFEEEIR